ncbi:MAG TPA: hypothetical protein VF175_00145 [Lacipirellula sp.]
MTKGLVFSLVLLGSLSLADGAALAESLKQESGRFADLVARLASREYVLGESSRDDRPYVDPSPALNAFRHVASAMAWGDVNAAAKQARELDYELIEFTDVETKRTYHVLREDLEALEKIRGWGSYIINPNSRVDALVEVPHPFADMHTPEIGGQIFEECEARGFLLAGAHREKADVPDLVDSIFHQVHTAWIGPSGQVAAWQIHGFASVKHPFPNGAKVVTSTGDGEIVPEIAALDSVMEDRGLRSYVFNELPAKAQENRELNGGVPGVTFTSLAATKNEQGRHSRSLGGAFVHVELDVEVRADEQRRQVASSAIAAAIAQPAAEDVPPAEEAEEDADKLASVEGAKVEETREQRSDGPAVEDPPVRVAARPVQQERTAAAAKVELTP